MNDRIRTDPKGAAAAVQARARPWTRPAGAALGLAAALAAAGCATPTPPPPAEVWTPLDDAGPGAAYSWGPLPRDDLRLGARPAPGVPSRAPPPGRPAERPAVPSDRPWRLPDASPAPADTPTMVVNPVPPPAGPRPDAERRSLVLDLTEQRFDYVEDDWVVHSGPISSGRAGYETPTGEFSVGIKEKNKFSSLYDNQLGEPAWMPWSVQFYGHYFVHEGWLPGYPASHGCVRVGEKDAEFLYANLRRGDPVIVTN